MRNSTQFNSTIQTDYQLSQKPKNRGKEKELTRCSVVSKRNKKQ